jgi:hypothetical protein
MNDSNPRNRCFHCVFTNCPGTNGALGSITPELLASLFAPGSKSKKSKAHHHHHKSKRARMHKESHLEEGKETPQQPETLPKEERKEVEQDTSPEDMEVELGAPEEQREISTPQEEGTMVEVEVEGNPIETSDSN